MTNGKRAIITFYHNDGYEIGEYVMDDAEQLDKVQYYVQSGSSFIEFADEDNDITVIYTKSISKIEIRAIGEDDE